MSHGVQVLPRTLVFILLLLSMPAGLRGQDTSAADERADGSGAEARALLDEAAALKERGALREAVDLLERLLTLSPSSEVAEQAQNHLIDLRSRLPARLVFDVEPTGTEVFVDGTRIGAVPLAPRAMDPGPHRVLIRKEGHQSSQWIVDLETGHDLVLSFALRPNPAHVDVICPIEGAIVRVDGSRVGTTPLPAPLMLDPGRHTIRVEARGHVAFEKVLFFDIGEEAEVRSKLAPLPMDLTPVWGWLGVGAGAALLGTGLTFTVLANADRDEVRGASREAGVVVGMSQRDAHELAERANTRTRLSWASYALGAAGVAAGVATLWLHEPRAPATALTPMPGGDGLGLVISGSFR